MASETVHFIYFGPNANCTLATCDIQWSVYKYRPSLPANVVFLVLFTIALAFHVYLGIRWRSWWFMVLMIIGCLFEAAGYIGRIIMWKNPFNFAGFMLQIIFVTSGPVFFTAAIYVTLSKTIDEFGQQISRIPPKLYYWVFIPIDVLCLCLQASGGGLSSVSKGTSRTGVDIALVGLGLQVASLFTFCVLFLDYLLRYFRNRSSTLMSSRLKLFFGFFTAAVVLIFARCIYRCYELSGGYRNSTRITNEGLFIGLEGVLIIVSVFCLCVGHPGFIFSPNAKLSQHGEEELDEQMHMPNESRVSPKS